MLEKIKNMSFTAFWTCAIRFSFPIYLSFFFPLYVLTVIASLRRGTWKPGNGSYLLEVLVNGKTLAPDTED